MKNRLLFLSHLAYASYKTSYIIRLKYPKNERGSLIMKLNNLLSTINILETFMDKNVTISGIAYHSQKVMKDNIFVCIKGYETDGHKYLQQAAESGAAAAIVETFNKDIHIPQYRVANSRDALAMLSHYFHDYPSKKLNMIGITATNGKTTTAYMTNAILENKYTTGLIGTVDIKIGDKTIPSKLTTPESLELHGYLDDMVKHNVSHVTMEVSSAAQEMSRVKDVDYDIVSLNNISREHIDTHGSFENYFEKKSRLITKAKKDSFAILNLDDDYSKSLINQTEAQVVTFSLHSRDGFFHCKDLDLSTGRARFTLEILKPIKLKNRTIEPGSFAVKLGVPGLHSVYNAMVAIIIALLSDVPVDIIQKTLENFKGVKRRFEFIHENNITIVDDHFANPGNINVTLETLKFMDYKKLHLVYAIRGHRGATVNKENAETIVKWASKLQLDHLMVTTSQSHVTKLDKVSQDEVDAFKQVMNDANINFTLYTELPDAIHESLQRAQTGDLILLAGCQGMDDGAHISLKQLEEINTTTLVPL